MMSEKAGVVFGGLGSIKAAGTPLRMPVFATQISGEEPDAGGRNTIEYAGKKFTDE
jgi:hypothetical protein